MVRTDRSTQRGQVLVIVALGMVAVIAMVGLVVDGGYAWAHQRVAQNGADAVAEAGTTVIAQNFAGVTPKHADGDVACAIDAAASANGLQNPSAIYTDVGGNPLGVAVGSCGSGTAVPPAAAGVKATGSMSFDTLLMRVVGVSTLTASADATAITGISSGCSSGAECALAPVTVSITTDLCDGSGKVTPGSALWPIVSPEDANSGNESIVALCKTGPGSFGGLDLHGGAGCDSKDGFTAPCDASVPIPTWLQTSTGNIKNDITGLNHYAGPVIGTADDGIIYIPMHDNTCKRDQPDNAVPPCPDGDWSGVGNNTYYHVPYFTAFMIDQAYKQIGNCNSGVGKPYPGGNASGSCMKGWFVKLVTAGPVGGVPVGGSDASAVISIQLIR